TAAGTSRRPPSSCNHHIDTYTAAVSDEEHAREHELLAEGAGRPLVPRPVPDHVLSVPEFGLERRGDATKSVIVMGAGLAGLVAAYELKRQGHDVIVLEAQNRVGGRVYTLRTFAPGLYAEAGAMRIPRVHDLTISYCKQ